MKAFNRIFLAVAAAVILLFIVINMILAADKTDGGRLYRVEISRLVREMEENGSADISECEYVTNIESYGEEFYSTDSDYVICEINGELYRFDYNTNGSSDKTHINRFFGKFLWGIDILRENIEQQKQRELELQKEKKTLLLLLSHDIKTPLSAIKLYSAALSRNLYPDAEKQHKIAENINEKADEIEGYVSQIVTASREDFLSLEVNIGEFYLSELIEKITGYYREKLALVKTDFIIGEYKNCLLSGDLNRSVEVLQNIVENSIKYGDGRRVELIFPGDDECAQVAIMNGGCTLGKDELPHIFESFWRGANAENIRGSGLGLYICRQLMRRMNGEIFAKIDEDIFTVTAVFARA